MSGRDGREPGQDERWSAAQAAPVDSALLSDVDDYDLARPLYRCRVCIAGGENSLHKYLDECPYFCGP